MNFTFRYQNVKFSLYQNMIAIFLFIHLFFRRLMKFVFEWNETSLLQMQHLVQSNFYTFPIQAQRTINVFNSN